MAVGRQGSLGERQCLSAAPYLQLEEILVDGAGWVWGICLHHSEESQHRGPVTLSVKRWTRCDFSRARGHSLEGTGDGMNDRTMK